MPETITLEVEQPAGRIVEWSVSVLQTLANAPIREIGGSGAEARVVDVVDIDRLALTTRETLLAFLRQESAGAANGEKVDAIILRPRELLLYERLGATNDGTPINVPLSG